MIQRRILAAVALLCAFSATAHAQPYTKAQLNTQVGVNFPDNTSFLITPQNVRTITDNIINSIMPTAPVVSGNVACYNGTTGLLKDCGSAPPLNPFKVKVQRTNTSGAAVWGAYDAFGNFLTACSTSTTACVQAAVNLAFPYASGTTALGYDFEIIGGNDPANGAGHNFGGGATGMQVTAPLQFPPIQGGKITIGAISFSGTINDGVIFDSCEMCTIDFRGAQISYHNLGGNSYAIRVKPTQGTPLDGNFGFSPAKMYGQTINGRMRFDLSGATSANITNSLVDIDEVNGATLSNGCIFQQDSPATGQNVTQNEITFRQLHGIAAGMTAFCDGNGAPGSGAVLGNSIYHITMSPDATNSANGIDSWGSNNKWFIQAGGFSTGFTLKFESGACKNTAFVTSDQASPIITDASGCAGANKNTIFVNGTLFTGAIVADTVSVNVAGVAKQLPPPFPGYQSGVWITGRVSNGVSTTAAVLAANTLYAWPLVMNGPQTWTSLGITVQTTGTATACRLGIFNNDYTDGGPGVLLLDAGTVAVTSTGVASATISQALGPLFYYGVIVCNGTVTLNGVSFGVNNDNSYTESIGVTTPGTSDLQISKSFTFGALSGATPFGAITRANSILPLVMVKH